ncbi:hypothetical protein Cph01nite_24130 [Cellulomonas phragmiteti]|uniref:Uncharacterized protein n=1 Tax=Cellulomonas phragmiteti TaxID=478780 RepID=A0ABQ4DMS3_9CELL|nr:hypothetical protein Cph01nite_24130 [Cellulomonas phragmiteti]
MRRGRSPQERTAARSLQRLWSMKRNVATSWGDVINRLTIGAPGAGVDAGRVRSAVLGDELAVRRRGALGAQAADEP